MTALDERIRAYINAMAAPVNLEEVTERTSVLGLDEPSGHRWPFATVAASVVAVVGLVAVIAVTNRGGEAPASQSTVGSVLSELPPRVGVWAQVNDPGGVFVASDEFDRVDNGDAYLQSTSSVRVSDAVQFADRYLVVGTTNVGFRAAASVWQSADGNNWTRVSSASLEPDPVDDPADSYGYSIDTVATDGDRLVAFGLTTVDGTRTLTAWSSTDASTWDRQTLDGLSLGGFAIVSGIVATSGGFLATGNDNTGPETGQQNKPFLLRSADGTTWDRVDVPAFSASGVFVHGIAILGSRTVAYGSIGGHAGTAAAWYSDDNGGTWTPAIVPNETTFPTSSILHATQSNGNFVLIGENATTPDPGFDGTGDTFTQRGDQDIAMWTTTDGANYTIADTTPINSTGIDRATAITDGVAGVLLAADHETPDSTSTLIWTWNASDGFVEQDHGELASVTTLSPVADGYIATAREQHFRDLDRETTEGEDTLVWILPVE